MRVCLFSDTHGSHGNLALPEADTLVFTGDWSPIGTRADLLAFNDWLGTLDYKYILVIAGNHDIYAEKAGPWETKRLFTNAMYLENEAVYIDGKDIWASPITPAFGHWAFMRSRGDAMAKIWKKIPQTLDLLVTHGPPQGILDKNVGHELCGCYDLNSAIFRRSIRYHVFGHIHEGYGRLQKDQTEFINCSVLNEWYDLTNAPVVIDI